MLMASKGHFFGQIPQPMQRPSEMKAILEFESTSIQSFPERTTGHDFLHSCRHFCGIVSLTASLCSWRSDLTFGLHYEMKKRSQSCCVVQVHAPFSCPAYLVCVDDGDSVVSVSGQDISNIEQPRHTSSTCPTWLWGSRFGARKLGRVRVCKGRVACGRRGRPI